MCFSSCLKDKKQGLLFVALDNDVFEVTEITSAEKVQFMGWRQLAYLRSRQNQTTSAITSPSI